MAPAAIIVCIGFFWRKSFWDIHNGVLGLLSALGLTTVLTELIKISVGRPRPDFISRCQPLPGSVDMLYGLSNITACSVSEGHIIADGFKSFPSGHASCKFSGEPSGRCEAEELIILLAMCSCLCGIRFSLYLPCWKAPSF